MYRRDSCAKGLHNTGELADATICGLDASCVRMEAERLVVGDVDAGALLLPFPLRSLPTAQEKRERTDDRRRTAMSRTRVGSVALAKSAAYTRQLDAPVPVRYEYFPIQ